MKNTDIAYPLINDRVPGLFDIRIVVKGVILTRLPGICEVYIKSITKHSNTDVMVTLCFPILDTSTIELTVPLNTSKSYAITSLEKVIYPLYISCYIEGDPTLLNSIVFEKNHGIIEPCLIKWVFCQKPTISVLVNDTAINTLNKGVLAVGFEESTVSAEGVLNIITNNPVIVTDAVTPGIRSINGLDAQEIELTVGKSFMIDKQYNDNTIFIGRG